MGTDQQPHYRPLHRRGFLQTSAAFALMIGLGARSNLPAASGLAPTRSIADLHFADFNGLVGQSFRVYCLTHCLAQRSTQCRLVSSSQP